MDEVFSIISGWMQGGFAFSLFGSFAWGLMSVALCPCHIAAIPLIVGYVGGQGSELQGRDGARYAFLFSLGMVASITAIGVACALLGRMIGDISHYLAVPFGLLIIALGLNLAGAISIPAPTVRLSGLRLKGAPGSLLLGLLYGLFSSASTLGFIAPLLAVIAIQGQVLNGALLVLAFATGHCLPLLAAGASASLMQRLLHNSGLRTAALIGRVAAGCLVVAAGAFLMTEPFFH